MPLRCVGEGARSEPWIGLTVSRAEAPSHDLLTQSRHKAEDVLAIHEGHVCKSQFVLALHKGLELFGLDLVLCQQQVASLAVMEIGCQFLCEGGPALDGCAGECRLSRVLTLATYSSGTGPGGHRLYRDFLAFHDEDFATLPGDVVGDGTADDPTTYDQHLNSYCWMGHPFGICFHDAHFILPLACSLLSLCFQPRMLLFYNTQMKKFTEVTDWPAPSRLSRSASPNPRNSPCPTYW
jgi:hypothetical protein